MKNFVINENLKEKHIAKIAKDERTTSLIFHFLAAKTNDRLNLCNIVVHKNTNYETVRLCNKRFDELGSSYLSFMVFS